MKIKNIVPIFLLGFILCITLTQTTLASYIPPPGGSDYWAPSSYNISLGSYQSGSLNDLKYDDDERVTFRYTKVSWMNRQFDATFNFIDAYADHLAFHIELVHDGHVYIYYTDDSYDYHEFSTGNNKVIESYDLSPSKQIDYVEIHLHFGSFINDLWVYQFAIFI
jgi:hypothetical protein